MKTRRIGFVGLLAAGLVSLAGSGPATAQTPISYQVTVENLTAGQPLTPPVVVAHSSQLDVFEVGEAASTQVQQIAENGNNDPLVQLVSGSNAVFDSAVGTGPVRPGQSATLTIEAPAGSLLSIVSMLICTNDGFTGVDSLALPASGSQTVNTNAYDAGTERNTEDFADMVPPCQELVGVTSDDEGTGMTNAALAEGAVIAMHAGIQGGTDLTVADHGWSNPVARITISAQRGGLPPSGTGPSGSGSVTPWLSYLGMAGAALIVLGGALRFAHRPVAE